MRWDWTGCIVVWKSIHILQLDEYYGRLVQEAAEKCVEANACKYSYFKKVLSMVQNNHSSSAINGTGKLPSHTNIRGKEAYK